MIRVLGLVFTSACLDDDTTYSSTLLSVPPKISSLTLVVLFRNQMLCFIGVLYLNVYRLKQNAYP